MASLNMDGAYDLTNNDISSQVTKTSAGNYALGYMKTKEDGGRTFVVEYVGRSDTDVAGRLKQHVGEKYKKFKYSYATSPKAAFASLMSHSSLAMLKTSCAFSSR